MGLRPNREYGKIPKLWEYMKVCGSLKVSMVTHVEEEPVLPFLSCTVEVSKEEEWKVIVAIQLVVLHPPHTLCDALHSEGHSCVSDQDAGGKEIMS